LSGGDPAHAQLGQAGQPETEGAADHDLDEGDADQRHRRHPHVAGAAQHRCQRIDQPDRNRAGEQHLRILQCLFEHAAAPAQQHEELPAEQQHHCGKEQSAEQADHDGVQCQISRAVAVAGANRAADRG
jgi:hypothetical protein